MLNRHNIDASANQSSASALFTARIEGILYEIYLCSSICKSYFKYNYVIDYKAVQQYDSDMIVCKLKQILKQKGWSRYKLQQESQITYPTLHSLYHGKSKGFSSDVLNRLCATLHCEPGDLLEWKPDRFPGLRKHSNKRGSTKS